MLFNIFIQHNFLHIYFIIFINLKGNHVAHETLLIISYETRSQLMKLFTSTLQNRVCFSHNSMLGHRLTKSISIFYDIVIIQTHL
jgi:hypothetical protein